MGAAKKTKPVEDLDALEPMLTRLKLTAIRDQLDTLLDQASRAELNLREALTMLCTAEVARKDERRIQMGMSIAKFPYVRTLEGFEYDAQPSVDPKQVRELATSRWVANGDSVLLLGPPGVGKTHLAVALGREAIVRGYSTLFGIRPAKSSCGIEMGQGCSCPRHFIADTWTLQESSYRAGGHGGGMRRSSESRLCRHVGSPACRSQPLHWPTVSTRTWFASG